MASALYPKAKEAFLNGTINLKESGGDTIKVALVSTSDYTYSGTHQYFGVAGVTRYAGTTDQTLGSKTIDTPASGVFDATDATFSSVAGSGSPTKAANALVIYKDTGTANTSPLIAYIDGFSVVPNGGNITVSWDSGSSRIFAL